MARPFSASQSLFNNMFVYLNHAGQVITELIDFNRFYRFYACAINTFWSNQTCLKKLIYANVMHGSLWDQYLIKIKYT